MADITDSLRHASEIALLTEVRTMLVNITAKLDADTGVEDTDYSDLVTTTV